MIMALTFVLGGICGFVLCMLVILLCEEMYVI